MSFLNNMPAQRYYIYKDYKIFDVAHPIYATINMLRPLQQFNYL